MKDQYQSLTIAKTYRIMAESIVVADRAASSWISRDEFHETTI